VMAAIAPALREELSPPPTRISGSPSTIATPAGPALAWQQGAEGQTSGGLGLSKGMAFAPMPPRRPDADEASEPVALAYVPLPPARPGSLPAGGPAAVLADLRGPMDVAASAAPLVPLPPPRPDARPVVLASASPVDIRVTGSTVKDPPKDPGPRPLAPPEAKAPPGSRKPPLTALSALMSAEPSLHMGFSSRPGGDLATNRFTGPAIKPLPVVR
jgi:hypothetical protein